MALSDTVEGSVPVTVVGGGAGGGAVTGAAAHDAAVSGAPVLQGLEARTSFGTAVSNGDAVRAIGTVRGQQIVLVGAVPGTEVNGKSNMQDTAADDIIAAPGAGFRIVVMGFNFTNRHASQDATVSLRDGTTAKQDVFCKAAGGGIAVSSVTPLFIAADNAAVTAISDASANILVNAWGYVVPA